MTQRSSPGPVSSIGIPLDGTTLSGLRSNPAGEPRGTVLALPGGGARARYWDSPVDPRASLLRAAAEADWVAVAVDRPGYGASADLRGPGLDTVRQAEILESALPRLELPGPLVVVAHSLGTIVAVRLAVRRQLPGLTGVALGGMPLVYTPKQQVGLDSVDVTGLLVRKPPGAAHQRSEDWYGPPGNWNRDVLKHRRALVTQTPTAEFLDARDAPEVLPGLLARIAVPVHVAAAEHELATAPADEILAAARAALPTGVPVETLVVEGSGHNLSLGGGAARYHAAVLSFAERASAFVATGTEG